MKKIIKRTILLVLVIILTVGIVMGGTGYSDYKQVLEEESLSQKTEKIRKKCRFRFVKSAFSLSVLFV